MGAAPTRRTSHVSGAAARAALLLASVLAVALLLEAALRLFAPPRQTMQGLMRPEPVVGFRHVPYFDRRVRVRGLEFHVRINSEGFRGPEHGAPRAGVLRVLGLGDSFAFGYGVEEDETYLARLEAALRPLPAEVINAGHSGMGPENEARLLEAEGPRLRPDLVLVGFYLGNDVKDVLMGEWRLRVDPALLDASDGLRERWGGQLVPGRILPPAGPPRTAGLQSFLHDHSRVFAMVQRRIGRLRQRLGLRPPRAPFSAFNDEALCIEEYPAEFDAAWEGARGVLASMRRWCVAHGARLALVAIPMQAQVEPDRWAAVRQAYGLREEDFDLDKPTMRALRLAEELDIAAVDLLPVLRRARGEAAGPLYNPDDAHWTPRGHAVAAEEILRALRERGLLPPATAGLSAPAAPPAARPAAAPPRSPRRASSAP